LEQLVEVWREVCQHLEIAESIDRIAEAVAVRLPMDRLVVRRLDVARMHLETIAVGSLHAGGKGDRTHTQLEPRRLNAILRWAKTGEILRPDSDRDGLLRAIAPLHSATDTVVGPLRGSHGEVGVLIAVAASGSRFSTRDVKFISALCDPLSAALSNDRRLRELAQLREAVEADNRALLSRLQRQDIAEAIVGSESGLRTVIARVAQVAPTDAPVLIFGETGTGKEVVARLIHAKSRRDKGPVVRVNCGALPPGLVDSELFGHERGSFTGATDTRKGWFERADGGTLFLDEVGELPLDAQVRLLRIVENGTFARVGGQRSLHVDVRLVTATHRDLEDMVARRLFREDLWYRIGVFPIRLPPLRERLEDLPALAMHFAASAMTRIGGRPLTPSASDIDLLLSYSWPGNIRELAAVIERAAILGEGRTLQIAAALGALPSNVQGSEQLPAQHMRPMAVSLDEAARRHIEEALAATKGRVEGPRGAAARLGVNPHTLRSRMRRLHIDWARFRRREDAT
jgi:transcriptional regulator with GAF, ATPase, and Fis domain